MSKEASVFEFEKNKINRTFEFEKNKTGREKEDLYSLWEQRKKFKNKFENENRWFSIPDVPELEKSAKYHIDGREDNLPGIIRHVALQVRNFRLQYGQTCGLTTFQMILGSLDKPVPSYEEVMGKPWHEISGSRSVDYRRLLASHRVYSDVKETVLFVGDLKNGKKEILRESIFKLLDEGNYMFAAVNWQNLHGRKHPDGSSGRYDHAIVVSGVRETLEPVQGDKINYLITDPNHPSYHNIWISERLLFESMLHSAKIYGYRIARPKITERIRKKLLGRRPVSAYSY